MKYKALYNTETETSLFSIRLLLAVFILLLLLSGITAFPLKAELEFLADNITLFPKFLHNWILSVRDDLLRTPPSILYGTDWLAFAHIVISLFFIPVFINPVKHRVNLLMGMIACVLVLPLAFICGPFRGIPFFHQLIDCSFGVFGFFILLLIYQQTKKIKHDNSTI